ncbi:hypothetical protein C0995_016242, partial [Termitomyces sp. Mi166
MAPKISLLTVSSAACFLEREYPAQKFIVAADAVFLKAQGLATLVPLHKTAFGLLEGLLDNWHQLNLMTIKWLHKAEVHQACINIWSLNKQAPWAAEFGKTVLIVNPAPTPVFTTSSIQRVPSVPYIADPSSPLMHLLSELSLQEQEEVCSAVSGALSLPQEHSSRWPAPQNKGKGKAKVMEDDDNNEEMAQKLRKELEEFVAPTT